VSSGVTIDNGGKRVKSRGGNEHALVNVGFKSGKGIWEFRLDEDSNGQECTCFGLGIKPVTRSNYDGSRELWMYRSYNGQIYQRGVSGSRFAKVHPGDVVRFELDMDVGNCRAFVNGVDQGVVYTDLLGLEVFPAVCFYSSGRTISLVKVEIPTSGLSAYLCELAENSTTSRVHGVVGKKRLLAGPGSEPMSVNGATTAYGLCTPVPSDGSTLLSYDLDPDMAYDCFDTVVGLHDGASGFSGESKEGRWSRKPSLEMLGTVPSPLRCMVTVDCCMGARFPWSVV